MEIEQYRPGDEQKILELFELVFKKRMSLEYWNWRFRNNPFSEDILIHLMWESEKLIGQYALSPVEMEINGKIKKTALAMTLMTHPNYQGKGVFAKLGHSLHNDLKNTYGYNMVYAFPNNQTHSHYGFVKNLGWKDITVIPMLSVKINDLRFKLGEKTNYTVLSNFDGVVEVMNSSEKSVKINKTLKYLNWRYIDNPSDKYKIIEVEKDKAVVVYKIITSFSGDGNYEVDLMEMFFANDPQLLSEVLNSIVDNESGKHINGFNIWKSIFAEDQIWFEKLGFKISQPLNYLSYLNFDEQDLASDFRSWEIGMGYSDVF